MNRFDSFFIPLIMPKRKQLKLSFREYQKKVGLIYKSIWYKIDDVVDGCDRPRINAYFRISVKKIVFEWNFGLIRKKNNSS
jgi:hypothetical protein